MKQVVLSKRLQMLADMASEGNRLVDVGCDHGFLSIYLVQTGKCPKALAMDVRKGPLAAAKTHVEEAGLGAYIETRLSDGLLEYSKGEADTLVCAGMGGPLMEKILRESDGKAKALKELILQPQSEIKEFRQYLRTNGFRIEAEDAVIDEGKYYFCMRAVPVAEEVPGDCRGTGRDGKVTAVGELSCREQCLYDTYGELLLKGRHPVLYAYLQQRLEYVRKLENSLAETGSEKALVRIGEVREELKELEEALLYFE